MGREAFVASGDKEKAERVSRNERPLAAAIEAADAARRRENSARSKAIISIENSMTDKESPCRRNACGTGYLHGFMENQKAFLSICSSSFLGM